jgi:hypothetical protein
MLCMALWRPGEYLVDKSVFIARNGVRKGFWLIDSIYLENSLIKKYYFVKKFIKNMYKPITVNSNPGCRNEI